jgi:hypothetical protein
MLGGKWGICAGVGEVCVVCACLCVCDRVMADPKLFLQNLETSAFQSGATQSSDGASRAVPRTAKLVQACGTERAASTKGTCISRIPHRRPCVSAVVLPACDAQGGIHLGSYSGDAATVFGTRRRGGGTSSYSRRAWDAKSRRQRRHG